MSTLLLAGSISSPERKIKRRVGLDSDKLKSSSGGIRIAATNPPSLVDGGVGLTDRLVQGVNRQQ